MNIENMTIRDIAGVIYDDWNNVSYSAVPYLDAMTYLNTIEDRYMLDSGKSIVTYFLSNASAWRGEVAKEVKAELKKRIK